MSATLKKKKKKKRELERKKIAGKREMKIRMPVGTIHITWTHFPKIIMRTFKTNHIEMMKIHDMWEVY